jgi:2-dehydro-3-deoxyphosphogluconate aldolase / (4S)-4-hydroxy-2-oxoglutarate aldolase
MTKSEIIKRILETGIVPVVRAPSSEEALRLVEAIHAGGIDIIELTMTVPGAPEVIDLIARRYGSEIVVGAGTVLDEDAARTCIRAGAAFVVSPILDEAMVEHCQNEGVPVMPGALTPTEVVRAWKAGADLVKVFPCGAVGGPSYLRALKAPLPQIDLMPTGGVSLKTVAEFIYAGASVIGAGTDLVDLAALREGKPEMITDKARKYVEAIQLARSVGRTSSGWPAAT